jgi:hypothetical protein
MPHALQAILPLGVLVLAALLVRIRSGHHENGWIAAGACGVGTLIVLIELLRLSPGEHVDVPYLITFPYADLVIRLDGLSLAFASVTLMTAALLMLARQVDRTDRRDPWSGWLLTSAAVCALMLAGNLLLLYILLQVVTLAWSGALNETAPRRRALRLTLQIADIGLLLAAASAIQSVGTSSYSGVPSDTFGIASFWLMLLPVLARLGVLAWGARQPMASVAFGPAIAWLAPAAYVLLRLLALMGGRLPDRPTAVTLFLLASLAGIALAAAGLWVRSFPRLTALLIAAQAAIALALSSGSEPLLTIASTWLWLLLIPLAGLVSVRVDPRSSAALMTLSQLAMIPGTIAFVGLWLGGLTLNARGLALGIIPIAVAIMVSSLVAVTQVRFPPSFRFDVASSWAAGLVLLAAFPVLLMSPLVVPAAATVRLVPAGTVSSNLIFVTSSFGSWPALPVTAVVTGALSAALWVLRDARLAVTFPLRSMPRLPSAAELPVLLRLDRRPPPAWSRVLLWATFSVVILIGIARP